jgi:VanZ family protein
VDGELVEKHPIFNLFSGNESSIDQLVLGNLPTGKKFWTGNLLGLAFYSHSLTKDKVFQHFQRWMNKEESSLSTEEGIVSLYIFDEHSGTLAHDSVGDHHLLIPSRFKVLKKTILVPPWEDFRFTRSYLMDVLTNILGFIPFGFFFSAYLWLRKPSSIYRILLISGLVAGCISLSIELIQVYLPTRSSQLTDVITNILGTAIGVGLFFKSPVNHWE